MQVSTTTQPYTVSSPSKTKNGAGVPDFDPNKPLDFLDDKGNEILDKLLEGRSQEDKTTMKVILNMTFNYLPSLKDGNQLHYVVSPEKPTFVKYPSANGIYFLENIF